MVANRFSGCKRIDFWNTLGLPEYFGQLGPFLVILDHYRLYFGLT